MSRFSEQVQPSYADEAAHDRSFIHEQEMREFELTRRITAGMNTFSPENSSRQMRVQTAARERNTSGSISSNSEPQSGGLSRTASRNTSGAIRSPHPMNRQSQLSDRSREQSSDLSRTFSFQSAPNLSGYPDSSNQFTPSPPQSFYPTYTSTYKSFPPTAQNPTTFIRTNPSQPDPWQSSPSPLLAQDRHRAPHLVQPQSQQRPPFQHQQQLQQSLWSEPQHPLQSPIAFRSRLPSQTPPELQPEPQFYPEPQIEPLPQYQPQGEAQFHPESPTQAHVEPESFQPLNADPHEPLQNIDPQLLTPSPQPMDNPQLPSPESPDVDPQLFDADVFGPELFDPEPLNFLDQDALHYQPQAPLTPPTPHHTSSQVMFEYVTLTFTHRNFRDAALRAISEGLLRVNVELFQIGWISEGDLVLMVAAPIGANLYGALEAMFYFWLGGQPKWSRMEVRPGILENIEVISGGEVIGQPMMAQPMNGQPMHGRPRN